MKMPRLQWSKELRELQEEWVQKGGPELRSRRTGNANKLLFIFTSVGVAAAAHKYKKKNKKKYKIHPSRWLQVQVQVPSHRRCRRQFIFEISA